MRFKAVILMVVVIVSWSGANHSDQSALGNTLSDRTIEIYVSPTGFDGNDGTKTAPVKTLEGAKYRLLRELPAAKAVIWLMAGRYERTRSFELSRSDFSAHSIGAITFKPVPGAEVILTGSTVLPAEKWQRVDDKKILARLNNDVRSQVRCMKLRPMGFTNFGLMRGVGFSEPVYTAPMELFRNHQRQTLAQWPNQGFARYGAVIDKGSVPRVDDFSHRPGKVVFDNARIAKWKNQKDAWAHGTFAWDWADKRVPLLDVDTGKHVLTLGTCLYGFKPNRRFKVVNVLEELDCEGEYYIDRDSGILYYLGELDRQPLTLSLLDEPMVVMNGLSQVVWENLTFEEGRSLALLMVDCSDCRIAGCTLRNFGTAAISIGECEYGCEVGAYGYGGCDMSRGLYADTVWNRKGGTNNGVVSCDIYDIGTYGVMLGGGDRKTLRPGGNYVDNCDIYRVARIGQQMFPNISIDGVGNRVTHCHIHQNPHSGIMYWGNDHLIEFNEIDHCVYDSSDSGAIYTGRDPSGTATIIRHNFIHHIQGISDFEGIFLDDGTSGQKILGNVFFCITGHGAKGIKYHGGQFNEAINNRFINCDQSVYYQLWNQSKWESYLNSELIKKRIRQAVDVTQEPYASRYPRLARIYETPYNLAHEIESASCVTTWDDPIFSDGAMMDFNIVDIQAAQQKTSGLRPIPFDKIGMYQDNYRQNLGVYAPIFVPMGGELEDVRQVSLMLDRRNSARSDLEIRYTLDGTKPNRRSVLYDGPFTIKKSCVIKACVIDKVDHRISAVTKASFTHFSRELNASGILYLGKMKAVSSGAHNGLILNANYSKNGPVVLNGVKHEKSVMICPRGSVGTGFAVFAVPNSGRKSLHFKAVIGIDDAMNNSGSSEFIVEVKVANQWKELYRSKVLRGSDLPVNIDLDVTGTKFLRLTTTTGHDNPNADHASWGSARFEAE